MLVRLIVVGHHNDTSMPNDKPKVANLAGIKRSMLDDNVAPKIPSGWKQLAVRIDPILLDEFTLEHENQELPQWLAVNDALELWVKAARNGRRTLAKDNS